ncbi:MAG: hypothetical protein QNJ63_27365 [Calothrix sp. MO_192.B10]|nr:hypothetical protein [Calothrix sp. MO_192.B10]
MTPSFSPEDIDQKIDSHQAVWIHPWRVTTRATQSDFRRRGVARQRCIYRFISPPQLLC